MKKFLGIVVLGLLWCNISFAQLIEIKNCIYTTHGVWDNKIKEHIPHDKFVYNDEVWETLITDLKISKKDFLNNYKKWGWNKRTSDKWYRYNEEGKMVWKLQAKTYITSEKKEKPGPITYDPYEDQINDSFRYILFQNLEFMEKDDIEKLVSAGAEFYKSLDKSVWSINTTSGVVTYLKALSDFQFRHDKDEQVSNIANAKPSDRYIYESQIIERVKTWKYNIDSYAAGILTAYIPNSRIKEKVVINFEDMSIIMSNTLYGRVQERKYKCTASSETDIAGQSESSGTAFFISNKGHLITNHHVVDGCKLSKINYFNKEYDTELITTDKTLDLALLKVNLKPKSYISFSNKEPKKRQKVIIAGYPLGKGLSDDLKINDGRISSLKGFENNTNEVTVDIAINPGNSGGPIVNEKGQLVAIAVSGLNKEVTEGLNFGIKASAASNFLKSNKMKPNIQKSNFSMDDDQLVNLLEESTVYTFCNK
jgi:S1-C subfamily serine protease